MTIRLIRFLIPGLLLALAIPAAACSSFASYAGRPLYGMNFDYSASTRIRFVIDTVDDLKIFQLTFFGFYGFVPTVGMNSAGLFISDQILEGDSTKADNPEGETIYPGQFYRRALKECTDVAMVRDFLAKRRLVRSPDLGLHLLVADRSGDALIVEVGKERNVLMDIEGDFLVMTNFSHDTNRGRPHDDKWGVGANRYGILYEGLAQSGDQLDLDQAFALLSRATNQSPGYPTRCSMVFDPERGQVFLTMESDFTRIWKVSLAEGVIETFRGFTEHRRWPLDDQGLMATDLH